MDEIAKRAGMGLTHIDDSGKAKMVDVTGKDTTERVATAKGRVLMKEETLKLILSNEVKKGDVLGVARVAGIMAAKKTSGLIPLCHPLNITSAEVSFTPVTDPPAIDITATARISSKTGVEMEALTAVGLNRRPYRLRYVQGRGQGDGIDGYKAYQEDGGQERDFRKGVKARAVLRAPPRRR
jgi:cyclic pyranopterin phosphate synthase